MEYFKANSVAKRFASRKRAQQFTPEDFKSDSARTSVPPEQANSARVGIPPEISQQLEQLKTLLDTNPQAAARWIYETAKNYAFSGNEKAFKKLVVDFGIGKLW